METEMAVETEMQECDGGAERWDWVLSFVRTPVFCVLTHICSQTVSLVIILLL